MKRKAKQTLIIAEIIGVFMVLMGVLAMITDNALFSKIFYLGFFMTIVAAALFAFFLVLALKEHKLQLPKRYRR